MSQQQGVKENDVPKKKFSLKSVYLSLKDKYLKLYTFVEVFGLILFYNPSGYSYLDWMMSTDFTFNFLAVLKVAFGLLLLVPMLLDISSSWHAAGFKGKAIFALFIALVIASIFSLNMQANLELWIWIAEFSIIAFIAWGAYVNTRDRKKFSAYSGNVGETQSVNVENDDDDHHHDHDDHDDHK